MNAAVDDETLFKQLTGQTEGPPPAATEPGEQPPLEELAAGDAPPEGDVPPEEPAVIEDDWLASLPEEVQAKVKEERAERSRLAEEMQRKDKELGKTKSDYSALHGMLAPLQRKLQQYESGSGVGKQESSTPAKPASAQTTKAPEESIFESERWKKWEAAFPDDAAAMREAMLGVVSVGRQDVQRLQKLIEDNILPSVEKVSRVTGQVELERERTALAEAHPDWLEINSSPEFGAWFQGWKESLPPEMRGPLEDRGTLQRYMNSSGFTINLLAQYKRDRALLDGSHQPAAPSARSASATSREALAAAPSVRGAPPSRSGTSARTGQPLSDEELFNELIRQKSQT